LSETTEFSTKFLRQHKSAWMKLLNSSISAFSKRIKLRSLALSNASGDCQEAKREGKKKKKKREYETPSFHIENFSWGMPLVAM
jgi:hypothetical protein